MEQSAATLTAYRARGQDRFTVARDVNEMRATVRQLEKGVPGLQPGTVFHKHLVADLVSLRQAIFEYLKGCQNGGTNT